MNCRLMVDAVSYFPNGSDHAMIACCLELYEEGEVKHINGVWPNPKHPQLVGYKV